jgi:GNAT superfamily N-acetyltransferase
MQPGELRPVRLDESHIGGCLALSAEAGWNQVDDDWRFMLRSGEGFGFLDDAGALVASGLTVEFPRYAWISMILVTPRWRRRGLATQLMERCVRTLTARDLVPALDASPEGRHVYLKIGFRDAGTSTRLVGAISGEPAPGGANVTLMSEADLPEVAAYDQRSSGTDRAVLLAHLRDRLPGAAFVLRRGGQLIGYVLARNGRRSAQIGPLVADEEDSAIALLHAAGRGAGPFCIDLFDQRTAVRAWLDRAGFQPVTPFIRMVHGPAEIFPLEHRVQVIAGPELS